MTHTFEQNITRQTLTLHGKCLTRNDVLEHAATSTGEAFLDELYQFLQEWFNDSTTISVKTSGSTGTPKPMQASKERMMHSARMTCSFLGLQPNDTALLCMPLQYIAGKMLTVRALVAGLNLLIVPPSSHPLRGLKASPDFAAMIPLQVHDSLLDPDEAVCLRGIRHLIIGGGAIDEHLGHALHSFPHAVWSTYGMTETLSHIALRRVNGSEASDWYTPFTGVTTSLSVDDTLVIDAPDVCPEQIVTNDIAMLDNTGRFRILGRKDNIINTGGVKVLIEDIEARLAPHIATPYMITSVPDQRLGEKVVLLVQGDAAPLNALCENVLPAFWRPKQLIEVFNLPRTGTGKPDRAQAKRLAYEKCNETT